MKKNKTHETKFIPTKNYIYCAVFLVAAAFLCWYLISWNTIKTTEKYNVSYLISENTLTYEITDLKEIPRVLNEVPNEYFIYISYTNDEEVYRLEKGLKNIIDDYDIKDEVYYVNVTDIKESKTLYNDLNNAFKTNKITNVPCIIYYRNGDIISVVSDKNKVFEASKFKDLLEENEFQKLSQ